MFNHFKIQECLTQLHIFHGLVSRFTWSGKDKATKMVEMHLNKSSDVNSTGKCVISIRYLFRSCINYSLTLTNE